MNFIRYSKVYYIFSGLLMIASILALSLWGLNLGIDFLGGSLLEVEYKEERPANQLIQEKLEFLDLGEITIQPVGEKGIILRLKDIEEKTHQEVLAELENIGPLEEKRFESIGPVIGRELQTKTIRAIILVFLAIILYIAWAFRKISSPLSSWKYGIAALVALFHDVLITCGIFAVLGRFFGIEMGIPFVAALLTILGYSVNDSIVVFDRVRENLIKSLGKSFEEVVNKSLNQTLIRSLSTSFTTFLILIIVYFLGGETIRYFVLTLIIGIISGTYSSIFIASPILVTWLKRKG